MVKVKLGGNKCSILITCGIISCSKEVVSYELTVFASPCPFPSKYYKLGGV